MLWEWVRSPGAVIATWIGLALSIAGIFVQLFRNHRLRNEEKKWRTFARDVFNQQLTDVNLLLRDVIDRAIESQWHVALAYCRECEKHTQRLIVNPLLENDEKKQIEELDFELTLITKYLVDNKIRKVDPSPSFQKNKQEVLTKGRKRIMEIHQRLENEKWGDLK